MTTNSKLEFSQGLVSSVRPSTAKAMIVAEELTCRARSIVEKFDNTFLLDYAQIGDPRLLHNRYIDAIFAANWLKYYVLNESIINSANKNDFLTYSLVGRSLIEVAATIRYYRRKKLAPLFDESSKLGGLSHDDLRKLIKIDDEFLRGGRFDWPRFFSDGFDRLAADYENNINTKNKNSKANIARANAVSIPKQVNVNTCIGHWARDDRRVGVLYELFCDMVHPNIGSTLCILSVKKDGINFGVNLDKTFGIELFDRSFGVLQHFIGDVFTKDMIVLASMKWGEEEF